MAAVNTFTFPRNCRTLGVQPGCRFHIMSYLEQRALDALPSGRRFISFYFFTACSFPVQFRVHALYGTFQTWSVANDSADLVVGVWRINAGAFLPRSWRITALVWTRVRKTTIPRSCLLQRKTTASLFGYCSCMARTSTSKPPQAKLHSWKSVFIFLDHLTFCFRNQPRLSLSYISNHFPPSSYISNHFPPSYEVNSHTF